MYLRIARQNAMPRVACFFEQKVTDVGAVLGRDPEKVVRKVVLVDENSGCLDLNASFDKYSLPRTHFDMNKFGGPGEEDFRTLGDILEDMAQQGPDLIASRTQRMF
ncbi:hypothetical protein DIS24_g12546 [Lasiodiplodia hormozganensis]|uniref:Uncharacterized protein n=1 Tax=Lasiodiplodia hormozganensis TaxID=869390 RepID=A0AA39WB50_9PEZI|nr:hypothetical protein DIS24_g12546 [Lasiodiplodia hormozganensis]